MKQFTREFYKIRILNRNKYQSEFYSSNNGTSEWGTLSKAKSIITRGRPSGRCYQKFENYEIVKFTQDISESEEVCVREVADVGEE